MESGVNGQGAICPDSHHNWTICDNPWHVVTWSARGVKKGVQNWPIWGIDPGDPRSGSDDLDLIMSGSWWSGWSRSWWSQDLTISNPWIDPILDHGFEVSNQSDSCPQPLTSPYISWLGIERTTKGISDTLCVAIPQPEHQRTESRNRGQDLTIGGHHPRCLDTESSRSEVWSLVGPNILWPRIYLTGNA